MQAYHPERLAGVIDSARQFHWSHVTPFLLGMRLFEGNHLMQEVLVPEFALVHDQTARINGQESYVVDARSPSNINDYARIWIECARGTPLQIDHYSVCDQHRLERVERVTGLKWHPIGDYGWFPIAGTRIEYRLAPHRYERRSTILTDPLSIRDISHRRHARLFALPFARGAIVYDTFSDTFITIDDPADESLTRPRVRRLRRMEKTAAEPNALTEPKERPVSEIEESNEANSLPPPNVHLPLAEIEIHPIPSGEEEPPRVPIETREQPTSGWPYAILLAASVLALAAGLTRWQRKHQTRQHPDECL